MHLSGLIQGTNNNFNLIRFIAASAVLVGHSFALLGQPEPLGQSLGMSIGSIAVDLFFITSGFLVASSLLTRQSTADYILARVLRIYPALIVMLMLTVFGLGTFFTSVPLGHYFSSPETYSYLLKCATLVGGVAFYLPGVFDDNPYKAAVNGSLWSMVWEIKMYILLLLFWVACGSKIGNKVKRFGYLIISNALLACTLVLARSFFDLEESRFVRFDFMFFTGAAFSVLKKRISLSFGIFVTCCIALTVSAFINKQAFFCIYHLSIAYVLFYLAYVPAGFLRKFNAFGDNSYGIYIYAFPIQQSVIALLPGVSVSLLTIISFPVTLCFARASWYLVEQPALNLKKFLSARGQRSSVPGTPV
ncbi:acyltransferase [Undibacterium sp.]|jgi:peptidoglycan/LPS O-acetylase OafA/YrhL|uniref:acyltransferase family protein n=1 Tax=Undibacterium sp. TaxID=1914977 RepID=UPI002C2B429C|nr:acyltransferase [Undibacterium sp.]HTD03321.1 acyltransferase [Undibacterium sp.]